MSRLKAIVKKLSKNGRNQRGVSQRRGQATVELALTMPLLALLLAVVIDGGLAFNSWMRVTTAARDATRFALDAGRPAEIENLVKAKLPGLDFNAIGIYVITGKTNASNGKINCNGSNLTNNTCSNWKVTYHSGPGTATGSRVTPQYIETQLESQAALDADAHYDLPFTIVEIDYTYSPFLGKLLNNATIPMSSFAIVQQYSQ